jgi:hypothetical protein
VSAAQRLALFVVLAYCGGTAEAVTSEYRGSVVTGLFMAPYCIAAGALVWWKR